MQAKRRFETHSEVNPSRVWSLAGDHAAVRDARTLFPSTVMKVEDSPRLLISGMNSRKIGDRVTKGDWRRMKIYTLTLEERATCPRACAHWNDCYGNAMHFARRHKHGDELEKRLPTELAALAKRHRNGFVVRLHVLGDFYSILYVNKWFRWLETIPQLHVFGYTAHASDSEIGSAIEDMNSSFLKRCSIRFSGENAVTIYRKPEASVVQEGVVCPAMTDKTDCCGTCGLCWASSFSDKTIVFIAHGRKRKQKLHGAAGIMK